MKNAELLEWLREQMTKAEQALRARLQAVDAWSGGTDETWEAAKKLHPSTAGLPRITKPERRRIARREERIAALCRRDLEMLKALHDLVFRTNPEPHPRKSARARKSC